MITPIIALDETTRVRHVVRSLECGGPKVVVRYRESLYGDSRPRALTRSYLVTWADGEAAP